MAKRLNLVYAGHLKDEAVTYSKFVNQSYDALSRSLIAHKNATQALDAFTVKNRKTTLLLKLRPETLNQAQRDSIIKMIKQQIILTRKIERCASRVWLNIHSLLDSAAMVSKYLWGDGKYDEERSWIRKFLDVSEDSPLANRRLRNHFEHFDERLEDWNKSRGTVSGRLINRVFVDRWVYYPSFESKPTRFDISKSFRFLDGDNLVLTYQGEVFDLKSLVTETKKIVGKREHVKYGEITGPAKVRVRPGAAKISAKDALRQFESVFQKSPDSKTFEVYLTRYTRKSGRNKP